MHTPTDINALFQAAQSSGALSTALTIADIGAMIQAGLGTPVDDVTASEAVWVTMMPDDSGSICFAGNAQIVRDGHNLVLDALQYSHQRDSILAQRAVALTSVGCFGRWASRTSGFSPLAMT
jgi:hypothetical protein